MQFTAQPTYVTVGDVPANSGLLDGVTLLLKGNVGDPNNPTSAQVQVYTSGAVLDNPTLAKSYTVTIEEDT